MLTTTEIKSQGIKCPMHENDLVSGLCFTKDCEHQSKLYCTSCLNNYKHDTCRDKRNLNSIPTLIQDHNKVTTKLLTIMSSLEMKLLEALAQSKQYIQTISIQEQQFYLLSNSQELESIFQKLYFLPELQKKINDISQEIENSWINHINNKVSQLNKLFSIDNVKNLSQTDQTKMLQSTMLQSTWLQNKMIQAPYVRQLSNISNNKDGQNQNLRNAKRFYKKDKKYDKALKQFEMVILDNQQSIEALIGLMKCFRKMNFNSSALKIYDQIIKLDAKNSKAILLKGKILFHSKKYSLAIQHIKSNIEQFSSDQETTLKLNLLLSNSYLENLQFDEAQKQFLILSQENEEFYQAYQGLAKCYLNEDKFIEAQNYLDIAIQQCTQDQFENDKVQVLIYLRQNECQKGLKHINKTAKCPNLKPQQKLELLKLQAQLFIKQQNINKAANCCAEYLKENEDDIQIYIIFGQCLNQLKCYLEALQCFDKVIKHDATNIEAEQGRNSAIEKLKELTSNQDENEIKDIKEAQSSRSTFRRELNKNQSGYLPINPKLEMLEAAKILVDHNLIQAEQFVSKLISYYPDDEQALLLQVKLLMNNMNGCQSYKSQAKEQLQKILQLHPRSAEAKQLLSKFDQAARQNRPTTSCCQLPKIGKR